MDRKQLSTLLSKLRYVAVEGPTPSPGESWHAIVRRIGDPDETPHWMRFLKATDEACQKRLQTLYETTSSYYGQGVVGSGQVVQCPDDVHIALLRPWYRQTLLELGPLEPPQLEDLVRFLSRALDWLEERGLSHGHLTSSNLVRSQFHRDTWLLVDGGVHSWGDDRGQARALLVDAASRCVEAWPEAPKPQALLRRLERPDVAWDALLAPRLKAAPPVSPRTALMLPRVEVGPRQVMTTLENEGVGLCFSPTGRRLATSWRSGVTVLDDEGPPKRLVGDGDGLIFSPDGRFLAGRSYHSITVWDIATGRPHHVTFESAIRGLFPTMEGLLAVQLEAGAEAFEWLGLEPRPDVSELTLLPEPETHGAEFTWSVGDGMLSLHDAGSGGRLAWWRGPWRAGDIHPTMPLVLLREAPDVPLRPDLLARLALSDMRGTVIWCEEICQEYVPRAAFSPDGQWMVCSTSGDKFCRTFPIYRWGLYFDAPAPSPSRQRILRRSRPT